MVCRVLLSTVMISLLLPKAAIATDQVFVVQPASQNVTESTDNVVFNCTAYSLGSHWYVQDGLADSSINIARGITESSVIIDDDQNLKIHLLYLPALLTNDNLTITCYIYTSKTIHSEPALLRIQGLLDPVTNLQVVWINASSMQITFVPPNTLDGIPILHYLIEQTSENNDEYNSQNITNAMIAMDGLGSINYTINVSAWNTVGQGDIASFLLVGVFTVPKTPFNTIKSTQILSAHNRLEVFLQTTIDSRHVSFPDSITIILNGQSIITANCTLQPSLSCDNDNFILIESNLDMNYANLTVNISEYITEENTYIVTIVLTNTVGNISLPEISLAIDTFQTTTVETTTVGMVSESTVLMTYTTTVTEQDTDMTANGNYQTNVVTADSSNASSSWISFLVIALCVFTAVMVILSLLIVFLMAIVMKYKKKNNKLKFAEMDARQKQRNAEVVLNSITTVKPTHQQQQFVGMSPFINGYQLQQSFITTENPQYETIGNIRIPNADSTVPMVDCPAYSSLPSYLPNRL